MNHQQLAVLLFVIGTFSAIQAETNQPLGNFDIKLIYNNLRRAVSDMYEQLRDGYKSDIYLVPEQDLEDHRSIFQTMQIVRNKIEKILNDSKMSSKQKTNATLAAFDSMNELMGKSFQRLANASNGFVNSFHQKLSDHKKSMENLFNSTKAKLGKYKLHVDIELCTNENN